MISLRYTYQPQVYPQSQAQQRYPQPQEYPQQAYSQSQAYPTTFVYTNGVPAQYPAHVCY
jgi:hypothetical protein